jgi:hypothetical protein
MRIYIDLFVAVYVDVIGEGQGRSVWFTTIGTHRETNLEIQIYIYIYIPIHRYVYIYIYLCTYIYIYSYVYI